MAARSGVNQPYSVRIDEATFETLYSHLFPGDNDEHGAVLAATVFRSERGTRLLVRQIFLARDGVDYVAGERSYKMLTAEFVRDCAAWCAKRNMAYLPVHNHGGTSAVQFSPDDERSHERGYPAIASFTEAPVCALVFAKKAAAGDVWLPTGERFPLERVVVAGKRVQTLREQPITRSSNVGELTHHRQALLLGPTGQKILSNTKVGVIGAGGVGSLLVEYLARLGVGNLVVVDPDRIDETNFSRMPGSTALDYRPKFWRKRTSKVDIAERVFRRAHPHGHFEKLFDDFRRPQVARRFLDCDYLFLAADPMSVRLLFNQIVHQYLIPGIAVGAKALIDNTTGDLTSAFSIVRIVAPGIGCLWCNGFISPDRLADEAATPYERRVRRYVDDPEVPAPSVITMNATGAGLASNIFLFGIVDLGAPEDYDYVLFDALDGSIKRFDARRTQNCLECTHSGRLGAGDTQSLTTVS